MLNLINLIVLDWTKLHMNRCVTGVKVNKSWWHMIDKKKYPQLEDQIIMEGFVLKEPLWILSPQIYWLKTGRVELQRIVKIRNSHHQGLILMCHCMCNINLLFSRCFYLCMCFYKNVQYILINLYWLFWNSRKTVHQFCQWQRGRLKIE